MSNSMFCHCLWLSISLFQGDSISSLLKSDYDALFMFSSNISEYSITEPTYKQLFWEGARGAINFYRSNEDISNECTKNLILSDLSMGYPMIHSIDKPSKSETTIISSVEALNQFSGQWHGMWKEMKVHHLWLPVRKYRKSITSNYTLIAFQSAFTGDGIGWNYIVKRKNQIVILGFVYHFDHRGKIFSKSPHFGFLNSKNNITWVSEDHIYLEAVCNKNKCLSEKHYIITGGQYNKNLKRPSFVKRFQAVYLREDKDLPSFIHIPEKVSKAKNFYSLFKHFVKLTEKLNLLTK